METTTDTGQRKIKSAGRVIGFATYFPALESIGRRAGWTFIANRKDVADKYPTPSPVFDDPKAVLRDVIATIGEGDK